MGFFKDCFTGGDSYAERKHSDPEPPMEPRIIFGTILVLVGIPLALGVIHPALGVTVLVAGILLGALLSR